MNKRETGATKLQPDPSAVDKDKEGLGAAGNKAHGLAQAAQPAAHGQPGGTSAAARRSANRKPGTEEAQNRSDR